MTLRITRMAMLRLYLILWSWSIPSKSVTKKHYPKPANGPRTFASRTDAHFSDVPLSWRVWLDSSGLEQLFHPTWSALRGGKKVCRSKWSSIFLSRPFTFKLSKCNFKITCPWRSADEVLIGEANETLKTWPYGNRPYFGSMIMSGTKDGGLGASTTSLNVNPTALLFIEQPIKEAIKRRSLSKSVL